MSLFGPSLLRWRRRSWGTKKAVVAFTIGIALVYSLSQTHPSSFACHFPALYNFGDSNSDTGSVSAVFGRIPFPSGETFFGKPSGRYSDGRLVIDFIADKLGLPYLSSYLDSIDSSFRHGANFAASGSTVQPANGTLFGAGFNPLSLNVQLLQFQQLKDRTMELHYIAQKSHIERRLPVPEDFSRAIYTLDCGQNDLHFALTSMTNQEQIKASIPNIVNEFVLAIEKLYQEGARTFWIHNTGPIGCLPFFIIKYPPKPGDADQIGCLKFHNQMAQEFNKKLKERVSELSNKLSDALLLLVDIYSAKYSLIREAKELGFDDPLGYCCGHWGDYRVECGKTTTLENGTRVYGASCSDPSKYISWDGIHYTEAANLLLSNRIMDGTFSDPPIQLTKACSLSAH